MATPLLAILTELLLIEGGGEEVHLSGITAVWKVKREEARIDLRFGKWV